MGRREFATDVFDYAGATWLLAITLDLEWIRCDVSKLEVCR